MARITVGAYRARHALASAVTWCSGGGRGTVPVHRAAHPGLSAGCAADLGLAIALAGSPPATRPAEVAAAVPGRGRTVKRVHPRRRTASASVRG
ncbi:hypothetical protein [Streptantibioticus ferralitis]|uniref:Uncharacterized protein n=1 Tax=Streptantibioticus ferralitis TaxID=236510 RepID=A0ABT5Z685_9ACTN|nr:hypothetical protein [Streptantibioticus ferralitis]MDF2259334.1 hypothetical protein [Streptantibioticus ferralitis]